MSGFFATLLIHLTSPLVVALGATGLAGVACIALAVLAPAWIPVPRLYLIGAGVACFFAGAAYKWVFDAGMHHQAQLTAALDDAAVERVNRARTNVLACNGGVDWDVVTGTCRAGR